ncbi:hypothetical protein M3Y94_00671600 [Aphelenchoides besseyi]|nr:hypothetical protein M3Y94_00671600 [Aphelenchoides besseyi]KAI6231347.1 hypothetical protein M3Y95_00372000 [Aphelenchoides besseyi]
MSADSSYRSECSSGDEMEQVKCRICRLKNSAVVYFTVPVCSGCKAFFRRTVQKATTYQCLNSRLCGKNSLVPNRRVCKKCRFDRCVQAGMLDAKVRLQNRLSDLSREHLKSTDEPPGSSQSNSSAEDDDSIDVLREFVQIRRLILAERFRAYGQSMETRESPGGEHDLRVNLTEYAIFNRICRNNSKLFAEIDDSDWTSLSLFEYSLTWIVSEQIRMSSRNFGSELERLYNLDCSYTPINSAHAHTHWSFAAQFIEDPQIYSVTVEYFHHVQLAMSQVPLAAARLDETEMAALFLLLMTRQACAEIVSEKTANFLQKLRDQTLHLLGAYLKNDPERMGQIIFLITDFQNVCHLVKHAVRLLLIATDYQVCPPQYVDLLRESMSYLTVFSV